MGAGSSSDAAAALESEEVEGDGSERPPCTERVERCSVEVAAAPRCAVEGGE